LILSVFFFILSDFLHCFLNSSFQKCLSWIIFQSNSLKKRELQKN
jgi:formate/nitrite transporter FocA (FNT family)